MRKKATAASKAPRSENRPGPPKSKARSRAQPAIPRSRKAQTNHDKTVRDESELLMALIDEHENSC